MCNEVSPTQRCWRPPARWDVAVPHRRGPCRVTYRSVMSRGTRPLGGWNAHDGLEQRYIADGHWREGSLVDVLRDARATAPDDTGYVDEAGSWTWTVIDELSDRWAAALLTTALQRNDRVAVLLPDGALVHIGLIAAEKAGLIAVGIGSRAGQREIAHLVHRTGARALLSGLTHDEEPTSVVFDRLRDSGALLEFHLVADEGAGTLAVRGGPIRLAVGDHRTAI